MVKRNTAQQYSVHYSTDFYMSPRMRLEQYGHVFKTIINK